MSDLQIPYKCLAVVPPWIDDKESDVKMQTGVGSPAGETRILLYHPDHNLCVLYAGLGKQWVMLPV